MPNLISRYNPSAPDNRVQAITPESAEWQYVGFEVFELCAGESFERNTKDREYCLVLVGGHASFTAGDQSWLNIGDRASPFERKKPYAVYVPNGSSFSVTADSNCEIAVCSAPGKGSFEARLISPDDVDSESRGKGFNQRHVHNILPDYKAADSLLVVEVYTDEGNTSSYPSHKHDVASDTETYLEETYYHRIDPPQGFAFQRVYTDDRALDESMAVNNKDVVMVPRGYHPVATVAGYNNYYLNVMAGPDRRWLFTWEDDHNWVNGPNYPVKA